MNDANECGSNVRGINSSGAVARGSADTESRRGGTDLLGSWDVSGKGGGVMSLFVSSGPGNGGDRDDESP